MYGVLKKRKREKGGVLSWQVQYLVILSLFVASAMFGNTTRYNALERIINPM